MFQMDELAKDYCQKYTSVLPIWCGKCKQRRLYLGEFSGCLMAKMLKEAAAENNPEGTKIVFENFLKLLTSSDTKESEMTDFVLKEMKNIDYSCTACHINAWEKIPEVSETRIRSVS